MPWKTLELTDSEDLTTIDVKKAYAKKLKTTRPDRDPEGFQKLRDSYEQALNIIRYREFDPDDAPQGVNFSNTPFQPTLEEPKSTPTPRNENLTKAEEPSEVTHLIDAILLDLKTLNIKSAQENLDRSAEHIYTHPSELDTWSQKLSSSLTSGDFKSLDFSPELLCYEIQSENHFVTNACIDSWLDALEFEKLSALASYINQHSATITDGYLCEKLACIIAIYNTEAAIKLSELATKRFTEISYFGDLDSEKIIPLGMIFTDLPDQERIFWHRAINSQITDEEWNAPDITERFKILNTKAHITTENIRIVRGFVPEQHILNVRVLFRDNSPPPTISKNTHYNHSNANIDSRGRRKHHSSQEESSGFNWGIGIAIFFFIKVLVFFSKDCSGESTSYDTPEKSPYIKLEDLEKYKESHRLIEDIKADWQKDLDEDTDTTIESLPFSLDPNDSKFNFPK